MIHYCEHNAERTECPECSPPAGQEDMFAPSGAYARTGDPATSHAAAARTDVNVLEGLVVNALGKHPGGLTSHEIAATTGESLVSISPRMKPLEGKGMVKRTMERRDRRTVWRLAI